MTSVGSASMTLGAHLQELRSRIVKSALGILLGTGLIWARYEQAFSFLRRPYDDAHLANPHAILALTGVTSGLALQLHIALVGGLILSSPIWIYQTWRFVAPGLHRHERKWAFLFTAIAFPLFLAGCWLGYVVLPGALTALFHFTPANVSNVTNVDSYISFTLHITLFFGLGFLLPLIMLMLSLLGAVSGRTLLKSWRWIVLGSLFFGAIATPNGDPLGMTVISLPIMALCAIAVAIAMFNDRRVSRKESQ